MKLAFYLCALLLAAVAAEELHEQWTRPFETFMMVDHPVTPYVKKNPFEAQALSVRAKAYIEANYKTPSSALLLDGLPTYSGTPVETAGLKEIPLNHPKCKLPNAPSNCESKLYQDYAIGRFALWLALPLAFAVLSILGCILFMLCKCCCMCSPCCKPKEQGYTNQEKYIPLGIMLAFCAIAIGASIYGIVANDRMSTTLVDDNDGLATVGDRLLQDAKNIFNKLADLTSRVLGLLDPTLALVNALLADTTGLELGTTTLTQSVDTLAFNIRDLQITVPGNSTIYPNGTIPCGYCQTAFKSLNDTNTEIKQKADSSFLSLNDTKRMINEQFINTQRQIRNSSEDAKQQMQKALNSSQDIQDQMKKITNQIKDYEGIRRDIVFAIFSLPFIFTGLAILGGVLKFSWLFTLNWFMGWTVLFLFWLLLAIHLPLSLALGDGCKLWDKAQEDPSVVSSSSESMNRTQAIMESCFLNTSLVEALGYDKDLNFTNKIKFPDSNFNVNQIFNFTTLNKFQSEVNALTPASFGYNDNITIALFGQINNFTLIDFSIIYTRLNIRDPLNLTAYDNANGPPSDRDKVQVLQTNIIFQLNAEIAANNTLNDLKYNTSQIEIRSLVLKADFSRFANATKQMEFAVQDLFNVVKQFVLEATCGFLAERYGEIKNGVCDGALGSVAGMSVGFFGIAIALFPMTVCAIILARRFGAKTANVEKIQDGNPDGLEMHKQDPDSGLPPTIPGAVVTQGEQPPGYNPMMLPPSDPNANIMMAQPQVVVAPFPAVDASTGAMMPPQFEGGQQPRLSIGGQQQPRNSIGGGQGGFAPPPAFIPDSSQSQLPPVSYDPPQIYNEAPSQPAPSIPEAQQQEPMAMAPPVFIPGSGPEGGQPYPDGSPSTGTSV